MEYKVQGQPAIKPRLIIHGGAGNIQPEKFTSERYAEYRDALLGIVRAPSTPLFSGFSGDSPPDHSVTIRGEASRLTRHVARGPRFPTQNVT